MATTIFLVNPREGGVTPPSYLLDTYSAAAAYSLRQLKTGVTSVVRVRRSSDNREENFTATEVTDGTLTGFCGGGNGFVVTLYDQSGNANDITNATAVQQPRLVTSGVVQTFAGANGVSFLASTKYLALGSQLAALNHSQDTSIFIAAVNSAADAGTSVLSTGPNIDRMDIRISANGSNNLLLVRNSGATNYFATASGTLSAGTNYLISAFMDSSKNMSVFDNGNTGGTNTYTGTYTNDDFWLGVNWNKGNELTGTIAECIIFASDQSANRTDIEDDINTYYSIY